MIHWFYYLSVLLLPDHPSRNQRTVYNIPQILLLYLQYMILQIQAQEEKEKQQLLLITYATF